MSTTPKHRPHIEVIEENQGEYTWRIVVRDVDTGQEIDAPISSVSIYPSVAQAQDAAAGALAKWEAGSYVPPSPRATG